MSFSKLAECLTLFLAMVLDMVFTLMGQPNRYWHNYEHHDESSPMGSMLLLLGPDRFVVSFLLYLVLVLYYGVVKLPRILGHAWFMFFLLVHSWGATSWLTKVFCQLSQYEVDRWYACCGYLAAISLVYGTCLYLCQESKQPTDLL